MRRTRLPRSFAGHPAPPFLSSPARTAEANSWLVSCLDAHARPLELGLSWAWTAVPQQLPGFVAVVRCGRCACVAGWAWAQRPSWLGAVPRMAASGVSYVNMEVTDGRTLHSPGIAALHCCSGCGLFASRVCVWGDAPQCGFMAPRGSLPVLFTPGNWHHWEPAAWTV